MVNFVNGDSVPRTEVTIRPARITVYQVSEEGLDNLARLGDQNARNYSATYGFVGVLLAVVLAWVVDPPGTVQATGILAGLSFASGGLVLFFGQQAWRNRKGPSNELARIKRRHDRHEASAAAASISDFLRRFHDTQVDDDDT